MNRTRSPEPDLTVVWQRHLPHRYARDDEAERARAIARIIVGVEDQLAMHGFDILNRGDLVVTISERPMAL